MFRLVNQLKERKGSIVVMEIVTLFIVVIAFAMLADLIMLSTQYLHLSSMANQISRTVAIQSGIQPTVPHNYPGGASGYYTTHRMLQYLQTYALDIGLLNPYIRIDGITINSGTTRTANYGSPMTVEVGAEYQWVMLRVFFPWLRNQRFIRIWKNAHAEYHF